MNTINPEQLDQLCSQIELTWIDRRNRQTVDQLAATYPSYAAELYDFFALLIEADLAQTAPRIANAFNVTDIKKSETERHHSLLSQLSQHAGAKASEIAARMNVSYALLIAIQRHPQSVPPPVREELADRAANVFQFDRTRAMRALERPYQEAIAASRDGAYTHDEVSFAELLKRAKLSKKEQQYWLSLADE